MDELTPDFFYLVMRGGSQEDEKRLIQLLDRRGIPILRQTRKYSGDQQEMDMLILELAGEDHSTLMLDLAQEGIGGDLAAYGKRVPGRF